jgi:hypothetical protein
MNVIDKYTPKGNYPAVPGSGLRNPASAYDAFDITGNEEVLRPASDRAYAIEWEGGTPAQMNYVIEAAQTAGLGNCSKMLRDLQARTVLAALAMERFRDLKRVNYLEPGAGMSTVELYKWLISKKYDVERIFSTLIEPSATRTYGDEKTNQKGYVEQLEALGLEEGKHFRSIIGKDTEIPHYVQDGSQHIVAANATLHHHAYQDRVFMNILNALAEKGFFMNFEWYEGLCEHPARVYKALANHKFKPPVKWETRDEDLASYAKMFKQALAGSYTAFSPEDEMAARMITSFWFDGWAVARAKAIEAGAFDPRDELFFHEAHWRPGPQMELLGKVGFRRDTNDVRDLCDAVEYNGNPHRLLTREKMLELGMNALYDDIPEGGSNLLMASVHQKL